MPTEPDSLVKNIVIVGGGSAGWAAAIALAARFPEKHITVVDSRSVGPIGVGEGATGVVFEFVSNPLHGLGWGELFRRCDATFKLDIWYKDWHGVGTDYLAPIDIPRQYFQYGYPLAIEEFYYIQIRNHIATNGLTQAETIAHFRSQP